MLAVHRNMQRTRVLGAVIVEQLYPIGAQLDAIVEIIEGDGDES